MKLPRIAIPEPTSTDHSYNQRCWPQYAHAIRSCGGIAVPIPLSQSQASVARTISGCCGILLPGSPADVNPQKYGQSPMPECAPSDPDREAVDELLLQDAFNLHKPILGVCYGHQALNVWRNGTLRQHIGVGFHDRSRKGGVHRVEVNAGSRLAGALGLSRDQQEAGICTNSSHHQAVDVAGDGMLRVGICPEDGVVEALELADSPQFVVSVQWHPERTFGTDGLSRALFESFVAAASDWKLQPIKDSVVGDSVVGDSAVAESEAPASGTGQQ
jgi:putative glutamine amidotransferase